MTNVLISYSRKDIAFARLLHETLVENQLETWLDWQDILPSIGLINNIVNKLLQRRLKPLLLDFD